MSLTWIFECWLSVEISKKKKKALWENRRTVRSIRKACLSRTCSSFSLFASVTMLPLMLPSFVPAQYYLCPRSPLACHSRADSAGGLYYNCWRKTSDIDHVLLPCSTILSARRSSSRRSLLYSLSPYQARFQHRVMPSLWDLLFGASSA